MPSDTCSDDTDRDWPGAETWLCDGCDEPKPTDECWPCTTDDGQIVLCPDCRDERGVDPILPDGGQSAGVTEQIRRDAECCPNCQDRGYEHESADNSRLDHHIWICTNDNCRIIRYKVRTATDQNKSMEGSQ